MFIDAETAYADLHADAEIEVNDDDEAMEVQVQDDWMGAETYEDMEGNTQEDGGTEVKVAALSTSKIIDEAERSLDSFSDIMTFMSKKKTLCQSREVERLICRMEHPIPAAESTLANISLERDKVVAEKRTQMKVSSWFTSST